MSGGSNVHIYIEFSMNSPISSVLRSSFDHLRNRAPWHEFGGQLISRPRGFKYWAMAGLRDHGGFQNLWNQFFNLSFPKSKVFRFGRYRGIKFRTIPSPQVLVAWPHHPSGFQSFVDCRTHGFLASEVCILMRSTLMYSLEAGRGINRILDGFA